MLQKIKPAEFQDKIEWLWEKVRTQHYFFDDINKDDYRPFLISLLRPDSEHWYNEFGMVSLASIQPHVNANVHFVLWDKTYPTSQLVMEARQIFTYAFETYKLSRVTATIPALNKGAQRLATLLGMKFEGTMRECFLHEGQYLDLFIYGILRREFEGGHKYGRPN